MQMKTKPFGVLLKMKSRSGVGANHYLFSHLKMISILLLLSYQVYGVQKVSYRLESIKEKMVTVGF